MRRTKQLRWPTSSLAGRERPIEGGEYLLTETPLSFRFPLLVVGSGSPTEILYSLQTFGISPDQLPINSNTGEIKTQNFLKWIKIRQAMEEARASGGPNFEFQGIMWPSHHDVLLGRGRPNILHRGNVAMRNAVESNLSRFAGTTDKKERAAIILDVIEETQRSGGRFLKEDPGKHGWWVEADQDAAKHKVAIYFRDLAFSIKVATAKTTAAVSSNQSSRSSSMSPILSTQQQAVGRSHEGATGTGKPPRRQELASSTYKFLEASSPRGTKRWKANPRSEMCGFCLGT